jgi:hypothetical protein
MVVLLINAAGGGSTGTTGGAVPTGGSSEPPAPASAPPMAIVGLKVTADGPRLVVSFAPAPADEGTEVVFEVQYRKASDADWIDFEAGDPSAPLATISDLEADTRYDLRVRAVNALGEGQWVATTATTGGQAVAAPQTCSNRTLIDLYGDHIESWWRVESLHSAFVDDVIDEQTFVRRLRKRLKAYERTYRAVMRECEQPAPDQLALIDAEKASYAADVAYARFVLRFFLTGRGTSERWDQLFEDKAEKGEISGEAWSVFAEANDVELSPQEPIDETKETD